MLSHLILASAAILPVARRETMASTIAQIERLPKTGEVTGAALFLSFRKLAIARDGDTSQITSRRKTCGELADAMVDSPMVQGGLGAEGAVQYAVPWFQAQIRAWNQSDDSRQKVMATTAARELHEILEDSGLTADEIEYIENAPFHPER